MSAAFGVLFLCTGNSARSILAEAILNRMGAPGFRGYSAGSRPRGVVHPQALALLERLGFETGGFRSKSWDEFAAPGAPRIDVVITVCDKAARETCPVWPGRPASGHWSMPDPAVAAESEREPGQAFASAYRTLHDRISAFCALPIAELDAQALKRRIDDIGRVDPSAAGPAE
jgi:protein-tyrosine-phosphatase